MKIDSKLFFRVAKQIMASYLSKYKYHVDQCPSCNADNISLIDQQGDFQRYLCNQCGCDFGAVKQDHYDEYDLITDDFDADEYIQQKYKNYNDTYRTIDQQHELREDKKIPKWLDQLDTDFDQQ